MSIEMERYTLMFVSVGRVPVTLWQVVKTAGTGQMKPDIPVIADVNVAVHQTKDSRIRSVISPVGSNSTRTKSNVLGTTMITLSLLWLLSASTMAQTTIIGARTQDSVVLGADGKVIFSGGSTGTACKIFQAGRIFVAIAGSASDNTTGYDVPAITKATAKGYASIEAKVNAVERAFTLRLPKELAHARQLDPLGFQHHIAEKNGLALSLIFIGYDSEVPKILSRDFLIVPSALPTIKLAPVKRSGCPGDCPDGHTVLIGGHREAIDRFQANLRGTVTKPIDDMLRFMIQLEVDDSPDVGPPISVLHIDRNGPRWAGPRGQDCADIDTKAYQEDSRRSSKTLKPTVPQATAR